MGCQAIYTWSLSGLVGAFLDLSIAYFLLCASAIAFMASKFLEIFGLLLPCPCDGFFFVQPNRNLCFQKIFIDHPTEKVSNVHLSVRSKFPFNDSMWGKDQNCNLNLTLIGEKERDVIELEGEASCSSVSDSRKSGNVVRIKGELDAKNEVGAMKLLGMKEGRFDMKGKGIMHQRPRSVLRRHRKGSFDHGKYSSIASYNPSSGEVQGDPESSPSINKGGNELAEDDIVLLDNEIDGRHVNLHILDHEEPSTVMRMRRRFSNSIELNEIPDENEQIEKNVSSLRELKGNVQAGPSRDDKNTIRLLEQALEEEHAARIALYLELDKERSAAATAADEAMAMIQRLQEEKASIEMEARQYQRIIEEKSAYDAEEMNILKEIIIRREREKHFLEKEVEAYHQMIDLGNERSTVNTGDILESQAFDSPLDPNEDPVLILQQLSASIDKKKGLIGASEESSIQRRCEDAAFQKQGHPTGPLHQFSIGSNDCNQELQDKMVPMDNNSCAPPENTTRVETLTWSCKVGNSLEKLPQENLSLVGGGKEHMRRHAEMLERNIETSNIPSHCLLLEHYGKDTNHGTKTSYNSSDKEPHVHDVHVIVNESNSYNQISRRKEEWMPQSSTLVTKDVSSEASGLPWVSVISDTPSSSNLDDEVDPKRSSSDMSSRLPPIGPKGKSLLSDLRRNSMSALDNERLKIDSEIGWLRERLRIVQEGREKLNLSVEHRETEKMQLKLLEDIARQLQEIRQLTEPGKAIRQASLPLPSSKAISRKRRCRSASLGQQTSS